MMAQRWPFRFAAHLGIRSTDTPLFLHSAGSTDPVVQIGFVAALGFAGIEDNGLMTRSLQEQQRISVALSEHGLILSSFVCGSQPGAWIYWGRNDDASRAHQRNQLETAIATAKCVRGRTISVVSGFDETLGRDEQLDAMASNLRRLVGLAEDAGVLLALEHISTRRVPGLLLRYIDDSLRIINAVNNPALGLVFDTHHVTEQDGNLMNAWQRARANAYVVQLADHPERHEPGSGNIDFPAFLAELHASGYDGMIEIECMPSQPGSAGEQTMLDTLHRISQQAAGFPVSPSLPVPRR